MLFAGVAALFLAGIFFNGHFFWCHWLAFAGLWFSYQKNRGNFLKGFLLPCGLVFFVVYAAYLYWLLRYKFWVYFLGAFALSLIFPLFFFAYHLLALKLRPFVFRLLAAFGLFILLELALSGLSFTGTAPVDFFFNAPVEILSVLHVIDFKVGCAWLMATCCAAGLLVEKYSPGKLMIFCASLAVMSGLIGPLNTGTGPKKTGERHPVKIALIQHNLPFSEEWRIDHPSEVKKKYEVLATEAAKQRSDLIIFPQYTFPEDIYRNPAFFEVLAKKTGAYILVASHVPAEAGRSVFDAGFMNLALLFTPEGKLGGTYQAMEEAPFGEIRQRSAEKYQVIETPFGKLGILLCYEDVTRQTAREAVTAGAGILISLSNPGMFLGTHMPYYHLQQDRLRAMETKLPLARVSPNGPSAFFDETGRSVLQAGQNSEKVLYVEISAANDVRKEISPSPSL